MPVTDPVFLVQRAAERFVTEATGISTRHAFSFGVHYDPTNIGFGSLVAHNDERLSSGRGFDDHPHRDTEIVTWVLSGSLLHQDSTGNTGIVHRGLVQRLSAGSGVVHAERNDAYRVDPERLRLPVRFVQSWVRPDVAGVAPAYAQREVESSDLDADWVPVASGSAAGAAITLGSAASTLWVTTLGAGERRELPEAPYTHLFVAVGEVDIDEVGVLAEGDALRVTGRAALRITGRRPSELLVWGMG
ncbi:MAG TPA: pirin family protein [Microlunatus sp.]|nr:pirin family protein [Microlunatus sp.]